MDDIAFYDFSVEEHLFEPVQTFIRFTESSILFKLQFLKTLSYLGFCGVVNCNKIQLSV